jgi:hypothetical protein
MITDQPVENHDDIRMVTDNILRDAPRGRRDHRRGGVGAKSSS